MNLDDLIKECTVQIITDMNGTGTGSFVASGLILTCSHVLGGAKKTRVRWQENAHFVEAEVLVDIPACDIAILKFEVPSSVNPPCIYLDDLDKIRVGHKLHFFGYPDINYPNGCPVTVDCEGLTGDNPRLIKFKAGQVRPGMSGSALLDMNSGKVCGIVQTTRELSFALGGGGILTDTIFKEVHWLASLQKDFHASDKRWSNALDAIIEEDREKLEKEKANLSKKGGKVLLLSTSPQDVESSKRREELKLIRETLDDAKYADLFHVDSRPELELLQLEDALQKIDPFLVDMEVLQDGLDDWVNRNIPSERPNHRNPAGVVANTFRLHSEQLKCIVLNGFHSKSQASDVSMGSDFLVSIKNSLTREDLLDFYRAFYKMLGRGREFKTCFESGINSLELKNVSETERPVFLSRRGEAKRRALERNLTRVEEEINNEENEADLWERKANTLRELDRYDQADQAYTIAFSIEPNNYKLKSEQADTSAEAGNHKKAINLYNEAIKLEKENYQIWWKKGQVLVEIEKYEEAVRAFEVALGLNPPYSDNYIIYRECAAALGKIGYRSSSIKMYKQSLSIESKYRASSYEKRKMYREMYHRQEYS